MEKKGDENYGYTLEELNNFLPEVLKKIALRYDLNPSKPRNILISNILVHQNLLCDKVGKQEERNIVEEIKNGFDVLPIDVIRYMAVALDYDDLLSLCYSKKKFNEQVCKNNKFQEQYGLKHLTAHKERLPKKGDQYLVLKEIDKLSTISDLYKYIGKKGYEKYITKLLPDISVVNLSDIMIGATTSDHWDIADYLLAYKEYDRGTLFRAMVNSLKGFAADGNVRAMEYLKDKFKSVGGRFNTDPFLKIAAKNDHFDMVKYLIENGADVQYSRNSALDYAAKNNNREMTKYLLDNGADVLALETRLADKVISWQ